MVLASLDDAKDYLKILDVDAARDARLQRLIDAVTTPVERATGRVEDPRSFTDEFETDGQTSLLLRRAPVQQVTSIQTADGATTWSTDPSVLHVNSDTGRITLLSGPPLIGLVLIAYGAGPTTVSATAQQASLIIIKHLWEAQRGTTSVPTGGDGEIVIPAGYAIPNRALELLGTPLPGIA